MAASNAGLNGSVRTPRLEFLNSTAPIGYCVPANQIDMVADVSLDLEAVPLGFTSMYVTWKNPLRAPAAG